MWILLRSPKMNSAIFGFQKRVWCPKCTPASSIRRMVTSAMESSFFGLVLHASLRTTPFPEHPASSIRRVCVFTPEAVLASEARALYHTPLTANNANSLCAARFADPARAPTDLDPTRSTDDLRSRRLKSRTRCAWPGRLAAQVLDMIGAARAAGVATEELDRLCHDYIVGELGAIPAPLNIAAPARASRSRSAPRSTMSSATASRATVLYERRHRQCRRHGHQRRLPRRHEPDVHRRRARRSWPSG